MSEEYNEDIDSILDADEDETSEEETSTENSDNELTEREKQFLARAKKAEAKLKEAKATKQEAKPKTETKKADMDYGKKAFLVANGIKGSEEIGLAERISDETGKTLDEVIESKYFKYELNELREAAKIADATPSTSKRSGTSARDSVDYWVKKGELPPPDQVALRRAVVNEKSKIAKNDSSHFTDNPVIR